MGGSATVHLQILDFCPTLLPGYVRSFRWGVPEPNAALETGTCKLYSRVAQTLAKGGLKFENTSWFCIFPSSNSWMWFQSPLRCWNSNTLFSRSKKPMESSSKSTHARIPATSSNIWDTTPQLIFDPLTTQENIILGLSWSHILSRS